MTWPATRGGDDAARSLTAGGNMARLVRAMDWSATPLGHREHWPQSLRTAAGICLASPFASCLAWGAARTRIYNDSFIPFCEAADRGLGGDFAAGWPDAWAAVRPAFERALGGETAYLESQAIPMQAPTDCREGLPGLSFVPVPAEDGGVGGVLVSVVDAVSGAALARANADLDTIHYVISHDIQSPLRTIEEMGRMILQDHASHLPPETQVFLNHFAQGTAKLGERVRGLLQFGRLNRQVLAPRRVDVAALVAAILEQQRKDAQPRQVEVVVRELPDAEGDPELIRQAFTHVLANAFKFTRHVEHPRIEIGGRTQGSQNEYFVADNGAGFDIKYAGKLFDLFKRMHGEAPFEGSGVGLALTRRIVERHGGTIRVTAARDQGATFYFSLPTGTAPRSTT